jgi:large subunit ribosomal protein L17
MRHRVAGRQLSRTTAHRRAMRRNLVQSLIEHETVSTTIQKAKEVRPFVERLITLAKKGKLQHRRRAISLLGNRNIVAIEDGEPVRKGTVVGKLFSELGPRYLDRTGGYTRIVRLSLRRLGDNGELVLLQLLGKDEPLKKERKTAGKRRRRKAKAGAEAGKPVGAQAAPEELPAEAAAEASAESGGAAPAADDSEPPAGEPEKKSE